MSDFGDESISARIDREWIESVEGDAGNVREADVYPKLRSWVEWASPTTVLEIGCGQGICCQQVTGQQRHYLGIDPSAVLIGRAQSLYGDGDRSFAVASADQLPCADSSIDAAFSVAVWHLLEDLAAVANELSRVLRSGGHFLIMTANPGNYSAWKDRYESQAINGKRFEGAARLADGLAYTEVLFLHSLEELTSSLGAAGLTADTTETFRAGQNDLDIHIAIRGYKREAERLQS